MAVEYGMPIDVLAKILGHSNTNMTRHYAKFSETVIGRAMEAFGERLASATLHLKEFGQKRPSDEGRRRLSLALFNQRVAQQIQKPCQPQFAVDDPTAALDGVVDADVEHPREQLDQLFHIGTGTVDTPSHAGTMQRRNQFHEIRRRERLGQIERRAGFFALRQPVHDRRMPDTQVDHPYLEVQMCHSSFPKRDKRRRTPFLAGAKPHEPVPRTGQGVQHVERRTMLRCHETLQAPHETRIGRFQAFKISRSGAVLQRHAKLFHKMTLFQKAQIMRYILFIGFHFSRFFVFCF